MRCNVPALKSEADARRVLAESTFQFMVDGLAYWPVPCICGGVHILTLPVRSAWYERPRG